MNLKNEMFLQTVYDSIFFFAKCYHCLGEAYSATEGILIYVIENIYLYRQ